MSMYNTALGRLYNVKENIEVDEIASIFCIITSTFYLTLITQMATDVTAGLHVLLMQNDVKYSQDTVKIKLLLPINPYIALILYPMLVALLGFPFRNMVHTIIIRTTLRLHIHDSP